MDDMLESETDNEDPMIAPPGKVWFDSAQQQLGHRRFRKLGSRREAEEFRPSLVRAGTIKHRPVHLRQSRVPGVKYERRRGQPTYFVQLTNPATGKRQYFGRFADMKEAEAAALADCRRRRRTRNPTSLSVRFPGPRPVADP